MAKAPARSVGFNLDSFGSGNQLDELLHGYDQVQIRNGNQNLILQRATADSSTRTVLNQNGQLQAVPAVGALPNALRNQATASVKAAAAAAPSKTVLYAGIGGVVLLAGIFMLKRRK